MKLFYADHFVLPLPEGHRFPMEKYARLRARLMASGHFAATDFHVPAAASDTEILRAHDAGYLQRVVRGTLDRNDERRIGFPWSEAMVERSRRSAGATLAACRAAFEDGCAANLAGGTHHAFRDRGEGFCVCNDAAIAALAMRAEHRVERLAVVDCDVHQGNGTALCLAGDDTVFTFSIHGAKNFPFRKEASDLDVDLPDGCRDDDYLQALELALEELARRFEPALVIYLAGADPHEGDRLGRLKLSWDGLEARDRRVFDWAWQRRIPLAFAMAGGYGHRIEDTVRAQVNTYKVAMAYWRRWQNQAA